MPVRHQKKVIRSVAAVMARRVQKAAIRFVKATKRANDYVETGKGESFPIFEEVRRSYAKLARAVKAYHSPTARKQRRLVQH